MYCKNCGKKLPDNARFCDRCNTSVRKKSDKMDLIEELKEERLARQKVHRIEHRYKKMKQYKMRKHKRIFYFIIIAIILGILSAVLGYINYIRTSGFNVSPDLPVTTEEPVFTTSPASSVISPSPAAASGSTFSYTKVVVGGIEFEYPTFFQSVTTDEHLLSLYYDKDNAVLTFDREQTDSSIKSIMNEFGNKYAGDVLTSATGEDWYSLSKSDGSKVYHSCGKLISGRLVKYYIEFDASLESVYHSSLEYMDSFIKGR